MTNFTSNITRDEIQHVISGKSKVRNGTLIQTASNYLRNSESAGSEVKGSKFYKQQEAERLKAFITDNGLWVSATDFKNHFNEGAEQHVYLIDNQNVIKINSTIFYNSWEDYLHNLLLHNYFFPDTSYELIGFVEKDNVLYSVVKQPFVEETEDTDLNAVKKFMTENGFENTKNNDYYNQKLGIILEDLHDENVLTKDGVLYFIDTVFYIKDNTMKFREGGENGGDYFGFYDPDGNQIGVGNVSKLTLSEKVKFLDDLHDRKIVVKPISKEEYFGYEEGDELTPEDLRTGNYIIKGEDDEEKLKQGGFANVKAFSKMQDGGEIGDFEQEDLEKISMSKKKDKGDEEKEKGEGEDEKGDEGEAGESEKQEDKSSNNRDLKKISRQIDKVKRGVRKIDDKYDLTDEQKNGIEKSLGELDDLKNRIQSGEQGDAKEALDEFNKITKEINEQIKDVMRDISKKVDDYYKQNNKVNTRGIEPCGAVKRKPKYKEGDKLVIENAINSVIQEIKDNPIVFKDLTEISPDTFNVGTGIGRDMGKIKLLDIGQPEWVSKLESEMKDFRKRGKKKSYYDIESMVRNIPAKQKTKGVVKQKGVYILLDVSGSMWQGSYKGKNLMELLSSYIPPIAKDFDGELWQMDAGRPTHVIPLKELRGSDFLNVQGGGGTNYDEALHLIKERKEELKSEGKSDEFLTILFTDTEVYWNLDLLPDNLLIVTLANKESGLPELDASRNQKGLLIEVDEDSYSD